MADDEVYEAARRRVEARIGFLVHLAVYVIINVIFLIVVGWDFLWATVFWGLGLVFHGLATFFKDDRRLRDWKERAIAKEMAKEQDVPDDQPTAPMATPPTPPPPPAG